MRRISQLIFAVAACVLMLLALALMIYGPASLVMAIVQGEAFERQVFRAIGHLIVAVAVFDVAKYLLEEEAFSDEERRNAAVTRRTLTKFISTIVIALLLEGLVLIFETVREEPEKVLYPLGVMATGTLLLIALGVFQRLSATVEEKVAEEDPEAVTPRSAGKGRRG